MEQIASTQLSLLPLLLGAAWLLPLVSFTLIVLVGPKLGKAGYLASYVATGAILSAAVLSFSSLAIWVHHHPFAEAGHHDADAHSDHDGEDSPSADEHAALDACSLDSPASCCQSKVPPTRSALLMSVAHRPADEAAREHQAGAVAAGHGADEPAPAQPVAPGHGSAGEHGDDHHAPAPPAYLAGTWYRLARFGELKLDIGYYIDALTVGMFCMVTFIASCIHFYAIGYMHDELSEITDHEVKLANGQYLHRPGRFHRFFQYLSLFCFSMLGLVVAGNIAMVFVFWELVGICSYFLIGFYIERKSASNAANKAFIVNRVGDFGMIIGLMALFGALGTFNFGNQTEKNVVQPGIFSLVRPAEKGFELTVSDGLVKAAAFDQLAQGNPATPEQLVAWRGQGLGYGLLIVAGLGIFCGCVGKSAQFPLHVWLPDAMEGPTPVSALVHSATMVAAGVYLVGRFFPVFTPEVLLVIAYCGMITLFLAATIAITATDIKRVLAYSTVSQLGYMMLALGAGGWVAGLYHLFTHAFFKSLLFMCSGSVIHACHTNEMPKMGGLLKKMPYTALTMLVGCLAIAGAGIPLVIGFSGYYSKDAILAQLLSFTNVSGHSILFYAAAGGAAITAFYMFRLWYLTFAGTPRDKHIYDHAHESPPVMYLPLVVLATLAICVAWPIRWVLCFVPLAAAAVLLLSALRGEEHGHGEAHSGHEGGHGDGHAGHGSDHGHSHAHGHSHGHGHESAHGAAGAHAGPAGLPWIAVGILAAVALVGALLPLGPARGLSLEQLLEQARPAAPQVAGQVWTSVVHPDEHLSHAPAIHTAAGLVAFATALGGFLLATVFYGWRLISADDVARVYGPVYRFLINKWYFDELYQLVFVRPVMFLSQQIANLDKLGIDRLIDGTAQCVLAISRLDELIDRTLVDGTVNRLAGVTYRFGLALRAVQSGSLRTYVLAIAIGTVVLFVLLSQFSGWWSLAQAGP